MVWAAGSATVAERLRHGAGGFGVRCTIPEHRDIDLSAANPAGPTDPEARERQEWGGGGVRALDAARWALAGRGMQGSPKEFAKCHRGEANGCSARGR